MPVTRFMAPYSFSFKEDSVRCNRVLSKAESVEARATRENSPCRSSRRDPSGGKTNERQAQWF